MKNIIRLVVATVLCVYASIIFAASYFTITKSNSVSFPSSILVGAEAVGDYVVTNVSGSTRRVYVKNLTAGFSVVSATGLSPTSCGSSGLANNASCTVRLSYESDTETTVSQLLPNVCPSANYDMGCVTPNEATSFSVVSTPSGDMTTLSAPSDVLLFVPGQTTEFDVTNTGSVTVNNIQLNLPSQLSQYLVSGAVTQCVTLAPLATCSFSLPMSSSLPIDNTPLQVSISASNAAAINLDAQIGGGLATASSILFTAPDTQQSITVTNEGSAITNLSIDNIRPSGVSRNGGSCGSTLAANASCTYDFTATSSAYGSVTPAVHYTQAGTDKTTTVTIAVANTTLVINPDPLDQNNSLPILGDTTARTGSFIIKNTGDFAWQAPAVTRSSEDTWLILHAGACTASAVAPGGTCTVTYNISGLFDLSSVITASGTNVSNTSQNFNPDEYISIGVEGDAGQYQHLIYSAVKVTNLTSLSETLSAISAAPPSHLASQVTLCNSTGSNCTPSYASDCQDGSTLAPGATCHIWYQANATTSLSAASSYTKDVELSATPSGGSANSIKRSVNFIYDNALYVGGVFSTAGGSAANSIAKWNGTSWSALGTGLGTGGTSVVYAITTFNGDLYAGGTFSTAGGSTANNIAKWNGNDWSALIVNGTTNGVSGNEVDALTTLNNVLYVGGDFTDAGGNSSADRIAGWNGSAWSALSTGIANNNVVGMTSLNNILYIGGSFSSPQARIAQWNGSSLGAMGTGISGTLVFGLTTLSNDVYAGGIFTSAGGVANTRHIAKWNGSAWSALGTGISTGNFVTVVAAWNGDLYAGGQFTAAGGTAAANIAKWNGSAWSALGSGLTGTGSYVGAIVPLGSILYVGGAFTASGSTSLTNVAQWDGTSWSGVGSSGGVTGGNAVIRGGAVIPSLNLT